MPVIVLAAICVVVAALLGAINMITAPQIELAEKEAVKNSLVEALPGGQFSDEPDPSDANLKKAPESVVSRYTDVNGRGYVVVIETKGYEANSLNLSVGVSADGKIVNVVLTKNEESKDKDKSSAYPESFLGLDAEGVEDVEIIAGITKSSSGIKNAIYDALVACGFAEPRAEGGSGNDIFATDTPVYRIIALVFVGVVVLGLVGFKVYAYIERRKKA